MTRLSSIAIALLIASASPALAAGPMAQLKESNDRIDKVLKSKPAPSSPAEKSAKDELRGIVNQLLDYHELSKRALKQHWDKLGKPQQEEFVATLRDLIEKNYVKQMRTNLEYQVVYKGEQVDGDAATVATVIRVKTKGKSTETAIDYKMKRAADRWQVFDVITDDVSMVKNYYTQFNKIITEKSFDELLKKMKKRAQDAEADTAAPAEKPAAAK